MGTAKATTTEELVAAFQAAGGVVKHLPTHSAVTGQIRGYVATKRHKLMVEEGKTVDELPTYLLTYEEKKERRLLPHQIQTDRRKESGAK